MISEQTEHPRIDLLNQRRDPDQLKKWHQNYFDPLEQIERMLVRCMKRLDVLSAKPTRLLRVDGIARRPPSGPNHERFCSPDRCPAEHHCPNGAELIWGRSWPAADGRSQ